MTRRRRFLQLCTVAGTGAVAGCSRGEDTQTSKAKLSGDSNYRFEHFGRSVAVSSDGTTAVVGSPEDENQRDSFVGSAYVFTGAGGSWDQRAKLRPDDADGSDLFGWAVAVSADGDTGFVTAYGDAKSNEFDPGAAYVYDL